jgi:hypothetical protein
VSNIPISPADASKALLRTVISSSNYMADQEEHTS